MIAFSAPVTVSQDRPNKQAVRVIKEENGNKTVVVDFYAKQSYRDDIGLFSCEAYFYGKQADIVLNNFEAGKTQVHLAGSLVQTFNEHNGKRYVNNTIRNPNFSFLTIREDSGDGAMGGEPNLSGPQKSAKPSNLNQSRSTKRSSLPSSLPGS